MLLSLVVCIVGIVAESARWPQDRRAAMDRFIAAEGLRENLVEGIGLALGHAVVRWLLAFMAASVVVAAILGAPAVLAALKTAVDSDRVSVDLVDVVQGLVVSGLTVAFALGARRFAG